MYNMSHFTFVVLFYIPASWKLWSLYNCFEADR
uniref:Uncharacterized protein n=1 Tax=Anguilla anguilla TaxID=7936 RepID=A0A0E9WKR2_ANGAN